MGALAGVGPLQVPRAAHTATRLVDGRVLIAGGCARRGCEGNEDAIAAELFDPTIGSFVAGPEMTVPRAGHTATLLPDGKVLIVGGYPGEGRHPLASAELFDPAANAFVPTGDMAQPRGSHTATALDDGRVLVAGGVTGRNHVLASVEIYDPLTGSFSPAASLPAPRATHAAVRVASGEVLVVGGRSVADDAVTGSSALYDPAIDRWSPSGELGEARYKHAVVSLLDGGALVIGGSTAGDFGGRLTSLERWDPTSGAWRHAADLASGRFKIPAAAAMLSDGRVVIAGDSFIAEVFDPVTHRVDRARGALAAVVMFATATALSGDRVLITGGYDEEIAVVANAYLYFP